MRKTDKSKSNRTDLRNQFEFNEDGQKEITFDDIENDEELLGELIDLGWKDDRKVGRTTAKEPENEFERRDYDFEDNFDSLNEKEHNMNVADNEELEVNEDNIDDPDLQLAYDDMQNEDGAETTIDGLTQIENESSAVQAKVFR